MKEGKSRYDRMCNYKNFPNLETERLFLRQVNEKDVAFVYKLFS